MKARKKIATAVLPLMLLAGILGCEDSDVTAPTDSIITLQAAPASVFIDQDAGQTSGKTTMVAQIVDPNGEPVHGVPVFFTSTGGLLATVDNVCSGLICSRSGTACSVNADCPLLAPAAVKTSSNGVAADILTMRLIEDPDTVTVTVQTTSLSAMTNVTKTVNLGPTDPIPVITATPGAAARTGQPISFSASNSTVDPLVEIECYEWNIDSSLPANDELVRGPGPAEITLSRTYGTEGDPAQEQTLIVSLRISDDPSFVCDQATSPPPGVFGPITAQLFYEINCDLTPPIVVAGNNQTRSLSDQNPATITLTALANDPESPDDLTFLWECGNGSGGFSETVTCTYTTVGTFTATVTVQNECGLITQDSLIVTINA